MVNESFKNYLFSKAGVSDDEFEKVLPLLNSKFFKKGDFVLQIGDRNEYMYFVEKGLLRMYSIDSQGKEHIIQFAPENWFIADRFSSVFEQTSEYFIDAIEDTEVKCIDTNFNCQLSNLSVNYAQYNERILQSHILQLQKRITMLIGSNAEERYLEFVRLYPDLLSRVPQWMIASYLGITPESLSRVRKELSKKK